MVSLRSASVIFTVLVTFCSLVQAGRLGDKLHQKLSGLGGLLQKQTNNPPQVPEQEQPIEAGKLHTNHHLHHHIRGQINGNLGPAQQPQLPIQLPHLIPVPVQQPIPTQIPQTQHQQLNPAQKVLGQAQNPTELGPIPLKPSGVAPVDLKTTQKPSKQPQSTTNSDDDALIIKDEEDDKDNQGTTKKPTAPGDEREVVKGASYCGKDQVYEGGVCRSTI
ncbi:hypothetical protein QAD02_022844 [Eretmocerus hayati]|uniref:Uncharacterized protein n=1 Tax=Eretmocerus hayati TaxID=131215 RepID=A0ACC2PUE9_9HYME|nr:hypothetical protein QAD02_022844 [Eretmocerus hayati]